MPESGIEIIAQVGDTHSLRLEDLGKRRFLRFGTSDDSQEVMQGAIHTDAIWARVNPDAALENFGLSLVNPDDHDADSVVATYFITGAIAYTIYHEGAESDLIAILASIREAPSSVNHHEMDTNQEFDRQYPLRSAETTDKDGSHIHERRADNSVARDLDAALAAYERQRRDLDEGESVLGTIFLVAGKRQA